MYEIRENKSGMYYFILKAQNGEVLVISQTYASLAGCYNGVELVKKYANSQINDLTIPVLLKK
jgi:uncharacterized protein